MPHAQPISASDKPADELATERLIAQMVADDIYNTDGVISDLLREDLERQDLATYTLPSPRSYATSNNYALLTAMPPLNLNHRGEASSSSAGATGPSSRGAGDSSGPDPSSSHSSDDSCPLRAAPSSSRDAGPLRIPPAPQGPSVHRPLRRATPTRFHAYAAPHERSDADEPQRRAPRE